jgi:hypothetical protein
MELTLIRKFKGPTYTIGDLGIDGKFFCNTIEDTVRELPATCPDTPRGCSCTCKEKIYARTAIPAGQYRITLEYSPRFKRRMPYLHDVPHFLGILIHSGNTETDSAGCIIVGENTVKGKVLNSRATFQRLYALLEKEKEITIRIG